MSTDSTPAFSSTPSMSAEAGFEGDESIAPFRVSGFICLLLGIASILSFVALPVLIFPMASIAFGMFALRRSDGATPVGTTAAKIGLILAATFGSYGLGVPMLKRHTLGSQAEYFARQYIELLANDETLYAAELHKKHQNRFLKTMSLEEHYANNPEAEEALDESLDNGLQKKIQEIGGKWVRERATRVYEKYGRQEAEVILSNNNAEPPITLQIILECTDSKRTGAFEWHMQLFQIERERLVAETVL